MNTTNSFKQASGSTGKAIGSFYYVQQYMREQSQTVVD
jgi:1-pyrroline-5-carboxylate dehydrogenase